MHQVNNPKTSVKNTTIHDVADKAGVTIGTVSHVINGTAPISEETSAKVFQAVKELGYKPNSFARSLRRKQSKMIGLLVPDLVEFYNSISRKIMDHAYDNGYSVMLLSYQYSLEREKREIDVLMEHQVDAIALFGGVNDEGMLESIMEAGTPVILCDRRIKSESFSSIEFDNEDAMRQVVRHLKGKGYKSLGYISEPLEVINIIDRFSGFKIGAFEQGYEVDDNNVFFCESLKLDKMKNGYDFMKSLLEQRPAANLPKVFVTTSDMIAIGVIGALNEAGYRVPEDFGVVGFDDLLISPFISPPLTTVAQDSWVMAKVVWDTISDTLEKKIAKPVNLKLSNKIVVRDSC